MIEIGDRLRLEFQRAPVAIGGPDHELVIDEIEFHRERAAAVGEGARREAARRDLQRDPPAVIDGLRGGERHLPDHLRPSVERGVCVLPRFVRQRRPEFIVHDEHDSVHVNGRHSRTGTTPDGGTP